MTCNFVEVFVTLAKTPEQAAAELEKQFQAATPQEIAKACKDQRQYMADLAAKATTAQDVGPREKAFFTGLLQRYNTMCDKRTAKSIRDYLWYTLEKQTKTCRIWTNSWKETFTKQLENKWVSNEGPDGICGVVVVSSLEAKDSLVGSYETQKVVTNKDVNSPFCQLDETKVRYAWDDKFVDRSCEFIVLGLGW
jgi:hypothetical protein